jgi:hypothetical protein
MLARAVLAIALVLLAGTSLAAAEVCCDEAAQIDEARADVEIELVSSIGDSPTARRAVSAATVAQPYASPALARVFRPPR